MLWEVESWWLWWGMEKPKSSWVVFAGSDDVSNFLAPFTIGDREYQG